VISVARQWTRIGVLDPVGVSLVVSVAVSLIWLVCSTGTLVTSVVVVTVVSMSVVSVVVTVVSVLLVSIV